MSSPRINIAAVLEDEEFNDDFRELHEGADSTSWRVTRFTAAKLPGQIQGQLPGGNYQVGVLELVAHASPTFIGDIRIDQVQALGAELRKSGAIDGATELYLSGCNTACEVEGRSIALVFAHEAGTTVYGARGYLQGYFALGNEETQEYDPDTLKGGYPDCSCHETKRSCWKAFPPSPELVVLSSGPRVLVNDDLLSARRWISKALRGPQLTGLSHRLGPDAVLNISLRDGDSEQSFEVLGNGAFLRSGRSGPAYHFPDGATLLALLYEVPR